MKVVLAIDSFKGCISSVEANSAAAEGIRAMCPDAEILQVPVSDGGEGFLDAFYVATSRQLNKELDEEQAQQASGYQEKGGEAQIVEVTVRDPLMRHIVARYLLQEETAIIEMAQASGLTLLSEEERNPLIATTYGTGQIVADAVKRGAKHVIVGLGGSATSDAGIGMLRALIDTFAKQGSWDDIKELKDVRFTIATDVKNPLYGENGAAYVFGKQKFGAEKHLSDKLRLLDERARKFAEVSARHFGFDRSTAEGAGAAGGLGYAFLEYLNAESISGVKLLLDTIRFRQIARDADLIITGEGSADRQTLMGKLPMGILEHAADTPVALLAGKVSHREELLQAGFRHVECINPPGLALDEAMRKEVAQRNISLTAGRLCHIR